MPNPSDLTDPTLKEAMEKVEALLDDGDYTRASKADAETYLLVLEKHPDLVAGAVPGPHTPLNMSRAIAWPHVRICIARKVCDVRIVCRDDRAAVVDLRAHDQLAGDEQIANRLRQR